MRWTNYTAINFTTTSSMLPRAARSVLGLKYKSLIHNPFERFGIAELGGDTLQQP